MKSSLNILAVLCALMAISACDQGSELPPDNYSVGDEFRDCDDCPTMVVVPAGSFMMGSPEDEVGRRDREGPQHEVTISQAFAVGKFEVTYDEWDACVSGGGCEGYQPDEEGRGGGRLPLYNLSWNDAKKYLTWLSRETGKPYRFLSESEWEYAARAGTTGATYWSPSAGDVCSYANGADLTTKKEYPDWLVSNCEDGYASTSPVGSFPANGFGLHDVVGNVWEMTFDCRNDSFVGAPSDGSAWLDGNCDERVTRGGSWSFRQGSLRVALREFIATDYRGDTPGFRVARSLD